MKLYRVLYEPSKNKYLPNSCKACADSDDCKIKQKEGLSELCEFYVEDMVEQEEVRMRIKPC